MSVILCLIKNSINNNNKNCVEFNQQKYGQQRSLKFQNLLKRNKNKNIFN